MGWGGVTGSFKNRDDVLLPKLGGWALRCLLYYQAS